MQKYRLVLIVQDYMVIDNDIKRVEAKLPLEFLDFEDVQAVLGLLADGTAEEVLFTLKREEVKVYE